jgi:hypothetical protein
MTAFALVLIWYVLPVFGMVSFAVGVVLRLCESSWGKKGGEMGSYPFLLAGGVLSLPLVCLLVGSLVR